MRWQDKLIKSTMRTTINSIFLDKVAELPPEPLPNKITKRIKRDGKFVDVAVLRKAK